jgi:hypothetical protein
LILFLTQKLSSPFISIQIRVYPLTSNGTTNFSLHDFQLPFWSNKEKFLASGAVSDYRRTPFDLTKKSIVVYVLQWLKKENVPIIVAAVVILLLFGSCCGCLSKRVKTMKAPGRNLRIPRRNFEASPSAYFRGLRKR